MKRFLPCIFFLLLFTGAAAQETPAPPQPDKAAAMRRLMVAYITQKLELTVEEAKPFWPLFDKFEQERRQAIATYIDDDIKKNEALLNLKKMYRPELLRILATEKRVNQAFTIKETFAKFVRQEMIRRGEQEKPVRPVKRGR
jgi:hypothetical protein